MEDTEFYHYIEIKYFPAIKYHEKMISKNKLLNFIFIIICICSILIMIVKTIIIGDDFLIITASILCIMFCMFLIFKFDYHIWYHNRICRMLRQEKNMYESECLYYLTCNDKRLLFTQRIDAISSYKLFQGEDNV